MSAEEIGGWAAAALYAITILATKTPNISKNKVVQWILTFINAVAMNWGKSKNA